MSDDKPRCRAIKPGGERCKKPATDQLGFCWSHSKESAEQRKQIASSGGKSGSRRSPDELEAIKSQLRGIATRVLTGEMERGVAVVLGQLYNTLLRSIEIQRKLDRQAELEERITMLEDELARRRGGPGWGTQRIG